MNQSLERDQRANRNRETGWILGKKLHNRKNIQFSRSMGESTVLELKAVSQRRGTEKKKALDLFLLIVSCSTGYLLCS